MVVGMPGLKVTKAICEGCALDNAFQREATWRTSFPLELIHSYICGPMQPSTKAGNKYFLTFIDDCTGMC